MGIRFPGGGGGSGLSQATADATYLKQDGTTNGGTASGQTFNNTLVVLGSSLVIGTAGSIDGSLILRNSTSVTRSTVIRATAPTGATRTITIDPSAMTGNRTLKMADAATTDLAFSANRQAVRVVTTTDAALSTDYVLACDATAGAFAETLPVSSGSGRVLRIKKTDASVNAVTITAAGTDTIDDAATKVLSLQYQSVDVIDYASGKWGLF